MPCYTSSRPHSTQTMPHITLPMYITTYKDTKKIHIRHKQSIALPTALHKNNAAPYAKSRLEPHMYKSTPHHSGGTLHRMLDFTLQQESQLQPLQRREQREHPRLQPRRPPLFQPLCGI